MNESQIKFKVKDSRMYYVSYYLKSKGLSWMVGKLHAVTDFKPIVLPETVSTDDLVWLNEKRTANEFVSIIGSRAVIMEKLKHLVDADFDDAVTLEYSRMEETVTELKETLNVVGQPEYLFEKFIQARIARGDVMYKGVPIAVHSININGAVSCSIAQKDVVTPQNVLPSLLRKERAKGKHADDTILTRRRLAVRLVHEELIDFLGLSDLMEVQDIRLMAVNQFREKQITENHTNKATPIPSEVKQKPASDYSFVGTGTSVAKQEIPEKKPEFTVSDRKHFTGIID